jgi:hypothetical protein
MIPLRIVLVLTTFLPCAAWGQGRDSCAAPNRPDRIAGVSAEGEIQLASGAVARLADLRLGDLAPLADTLAWLRQHDGAAVSVATGAPDRWERLPARIAAESGDLARGLVERGLALVDAGGQGQLCAPELLKVEAEARAQRRGIWALAGHQPLQAGDGAALRQRVGRFALVEGRVLSVGERAQRTYLNFGRNYAQDFTVTIPKRSWATMIDRGISAAALRGRKVRARGVVEDWNGTALTLQVPELLELLD